MKLRHHDHGLVLEQVFERPPEAMNAARSSDSEENYGTIKFLKTTVWNFATANPEFNRLFNDGLVCTSKGVLKAVLSTHREGFAAMGSESVVVDVGGGTGMAVAEIVKTHLHTQGINFDLPNVVDTASQYLGVSHVGGDMDWWMVDDELIGE
ncbi:hypothetical protein NE237_009476 [Protea cynaroides]|uniref:O-methyltransferase C-terminal domain-containing protein n=1 Tax=Protea cynaroides TaxID=273540 RepID=A0A9Q0KYP3_9MAGN|nr:hypothetical protein NE237_009476 [Protea cynaroides]